MIVDSQQVFFDQAEKSSASASARSKQAVRELETVRNSTTKDLHGYSQVWG